VPSGRPRCGPGSARSWGMRWLSSYRPGAPACTCEATASWRVAAASADRRGCRTNVPRRGRWIASKRGLRNCPSRPSRAAGPSRVAPHVGCGVHFRECAARFLRRLSATASVRGRRLVGVSADDCIQAEAAVSERPDAALACRWTAISCRRRALSGLPKLCLNGRVFGQRSGKSPWPKSVLMD
jgi:hypothetical protein